MPRRAALAVVLAFACGCGDEGRRGGDVAPLEVPSAEEREAVRLFAEAKELLDAGADKEAEPLLRRVLERAPRHAGALGALSRIVVERRAFDEGAELAARLVEASPSDAAARARLVEAHTGRRDLAAAEAAARAWTKEAPNNSDAWFALGNALSAARRWEPAVQALKQASTLKAARADVRSALGLVYEAQGKRAEAEAAQRDAIQRDPRFGLAWLRLAVLLEEGGAAREAEAITAYGNAIKWEPARCSPARADLYRLLRRAADRDPSQAAAAELEWKSLVRVAGRDLLPWSGLGAPPAEPPSDRAERALRAALEAKPDDAEARMRYAMLLHRRGELDAAVEEYAEAMLADPSMARLRAALGAAFLAKGDPGTAEPQLREAARLDPTDTVTWRNLGWALVTGGRSADAVAPLTEALSRNPSDRLARRALGIARLGAGELDAGIEELTAAGWRAK